MKQPEHIPDGPLFRLLIPPEPRRYPGQRWIKVLARSAHVVLSGIYVGAYVLDVGMDALLPWFLATFFSGVLMICLDLYESGAFLLQMRGLVVAAKLVLLAFVPMLGAAGVWVVVAVAFFSVLSSHATSSFRYYLIWGRGKIKASETKG